MAAPQEGARLPFRPLAGTLSLRMPQGGMELPRPVAVTSQPQKAAGVGRNKGAPLGPTPFVLSRIPGSGPGWAAPREPWEGETKGGRWSAFLTLLILCGWGQAPQEEGKVVGVLRAHLSTPTLTPAVRSRFQLS